MEAQDNISGNEYEKTDSRRNASYSALFRRFVLLTVLCSILPLLLVGWGLNQYYTRFSISRVTAYFNDETGFHRSMIEMFLTERISKLQLLANTHSITYFLDTKNLNKAFELINQNRRDITDLGIIDEKGDHLAYTGPYQLMGKNYSEAFWFKKVMEENVYISDMFMGFRNEPHFIMAVTREESGKKWILRATVDTETFRSLVEDVKIGRTGEVYLINREGIFQTNPRFSGEIMKKSPAPVGSPHAGIKVRIINKKDRQEARDMVVSQTWLSNPQWMLVVKQDYAEAFGEVIHANNASFIFLAMTSAIILIITIFITRHMIAIIRKRDAEAAHLNEQLMQAGKMASIGELSAGVAHEINNPLAIIVTEKQILLDLAKKADTTLDALKNQLTGSLAQIDIQIKHCKRITHNLLKFARRTRSIIEPIDINAFITEIVDLMKREAGTSGIKFFCDFDQEHPNILSDPSQLQQVFLNIINNSIAAHESKPYGTITISTRSDDRDRGIVVTFADTGSGISPEHLDKIFDPFFTTKPAGKGTGLGLSICRDIVKKLGGNISVRSEYGQGTEFTIFLPYIPPPGIEKS